MIAALSLESECGITLSQIAGTKLNICAILSSLKKHKDSIRYCASGISDLMNILKIIKIKRIKDKDKQETFMMQEGFTDRDLD